VLCSKSAKTQPRETRRLRSKHGKHGEGKPNKCRAVVSKKAEARKDALEEVYSACSGKETKDETQECLEAAADEEDIKLMYKEGENKWKKIKSDFQKVCFNMIRKSYKDCMATNKTEGRRAVCNEEMAFELDKFGINSNKLTRRTKSQGMRESPCFEKRGQDRKDCMKKAKEECEEQESDKQACKGATTATIVNQVAEECAACLEEDVDEDGEQIAEETLKEECWILAKQRLCDKSAIEEGKHCDRYADRKKKRVMYLCDVHNKGIRTENVPLPQIHSDTTTDDTDCLDSVASQLLKNASKTMDVVTNGEKMNTDVRPADPNCVVANGEALYSLKVGFDDGVNDDTIQAMSDTFSEVLSGMNADRKARRLASILASEAAQDIEECAEDDESCGSLSSDEERKSVSAAANMVTKSSISCFMCFLAIAFCGSMVGPA